MNSAIVQSSCERKRERNGGKNVNDLEITDIIPINVLKEHITYDAKA